MQWNVDTIYIESWLDGLDEGSYEMVIAALEILADRGPNLGRPLVDQIKSSDYQNMKELRPSSKGRSAIRILFAFDPGRNAIMLIAGNKENKWKSWYREHIPMADSLWEQHLKKFEGK